MSFAPSIVSTAAEQRLMLLEGRPFVQPLSAPAFGSAARGIYLGRFHSRVASRYDLMLQTWFRFQVA